MIKRKERVCRSIMAPKQDLMKMEYRHEDGDEFMDYSWERAFSIKLCREEQVFTQPKFVVILGLYEPSELKYLLFPNNLEINDKEFADNKYWKRIGEPTKTNKRTSLVKDPLMRIVHRLLVGALVHRTRSRERCQKADLWMMIMLEEGRFANMAWIIAEYLYKKTSGIKENSDVCRGHYVTKIVKDLGYYVKEEVAKCSKPIECEEWTDEMFTKELDRENWSWGDWNASLNEIEHRDVWIDSMLMRNNYMLEHSMPILHLLADQAIYTYPAYEPRNIPPYPYPYVPYPHPYTHYPNMGNQSHGGEHYGDHFTGTMPNYGGNSIVPSLVTRLENRQEEFMMTTRR
ncbi:hypothetical protein Tco_0264974 [Tanacetum coccineum]